MIQIPLDRALRVGRSVSQEAFQSGPPPERWTAADAVAESGPDNEYALVCESGPHSAILAYLFSFLRIAAQPMTVTPRCRDERPGIKPQKWEKVRVVQLRRFHQMASVDGPHRQVNWQLMGGPYAQGPSVVPQSGSAPIYLPRPIHQRAHQRSTACRRKGASPRPLTL